MRYAIDRSRPTMAWQMHALNHAVKNVFRAVDLTGRYTQIVRGEDMVFVSKEVAQAVSTGLACPRV